MRTLIETYELLLESKKAEEILRNSNFTEEEIANIIGELKADNNEQYLPMMVTVVSWGEKNYNTIKELFVEYNKLFKNNNIGKIFASNGKITIKGKDGKDNEFSDFIKLTEYIHGVRDNVYTNKYGYSYKEYKAEDRPIQSSNGIDVYEADNVGKCIKYSQGRLTGKIYSFCIGKPANTMYQSYRDSNVSTFYFIVDRNKFVTNPDGSVNLDNPLHMVVYDVKMNSIELTDANNTTGTIAEYGEDVEAYQEYLSSKGIKIDELKNRPKTSEEETEDEILGGKNESLEWFEQLSLDYKSKYIGRGHLLTDEQFTIIVPNKQLLNQYVNIGQVLPYNQFKIIEKIPSAFNSYMKARNIAIINGDKVSLEELDVLPEKTIENIVNFSHSSYDKKKLEEIPHKIKKLTSLKRLSFANNNIKSVPNWIGDLKNLININLSDNQINNLPNSIGELNLLHTLNLSNNNIEKLPNSIRNLTSLKLLVIIGNKIPEQEIINLKQLLPNCKIYYEGTIHQMKRSVRRLGLG